VPHVKHPVGSFWWPDVMSLSLDFWGLAACAVGNGRSVCFWDDVWNGSLLKLDFPQLYSYASRVGANYQARRARAPPLRLSVT
jgi:hypothetical protein